ncbi:MAG: GNAT family N-acetyltransferase [Firmicutes bacterium]|nr:GNAT family N-acetyltransferase [Bacillota bacterium]
MMIKITNPDDLDVNKLMSIYVEGNFENTDYFYPEITDKTEAVKKVEHDFCNYIKTEFLNGENVYYVWENDGVWVSALRLYCIEENFYYLEALETAPDFRKKGYATLLLTSVINELKLKGHFKICVCVGRNNIASLNTHKKCGFKIVSENGFDYLQKETDDRCYGLEYSF